VAHQPVPRNVHPAVARARSSVARRIQVGAPPEQVEAARAQLLDAKAIERADAIAESWPAISDEAREQIALIIGSGQAAAPGE
jgi:hypothetical protein